MCHGRLLHGWVRHDPRAGISNTASAALANQSGQHAASIPSTDYEMDPEHGLAAWSTPRRRLAIGWTVFGAAFVLFTVFLGLPYSEDEILLWLTAALLVASVGDPSRCAGVSSATGCPLRRAGGLRPLARLRQPCALGAIRTAAGRLRHVHRRRPATTVTLQRWLFRANDIRRGTTWHGSPI